MNCIFLSTFILIAFGVFVTNCSNSNSESVQWMPGPGPVGHTGSSGGRGKGYIVSERPWSNAIHRTGGKVLRFFKKLSNKVYGERYWKPWRGIPPNKPFQFVKSTNSGWGKQPQQPQHSYSNSNAHKANPHQNGGTNYGHQLNGGQGGHGK